MDMVNKRASIRRRTMSLPVKIYTAFFGLSVLLYILLTFVPLPDTDTLNHYNLSASHYRWLILPIVIFLVIIWLAGLYGSLKVKSYASLIGRSTDGRAINVLAAGFMVLAIMMPITSDLSSITSLVSRGSPAARETLTIITNYIDLVIMAVAMWLIGDGAARLASLAGNNRKAWSEKFWVLFFITFSALYGYFIVNQPPETPRHHVYYLPHWLLLISIVIPYLFFWYVGLKGAVQIFLYRQNVRGKLYKSSLSFLAAGIALVIIGFIITRILTTLSTKLSHLNLTPVLIIIYVLLAVIAAGYLLIAVGAKKLRRLEEV